MVVMFRVPVSAEVPTFDDTFKVGIWRWLTSGKVERVEWMRRRNAAAKAAERAQLDRLEEHREEFKADYRAARDEQKRRRREG